MSQFATGIVLNFTCQGINNYNGNKYMNVSEKSNLINKNISNLSLIGIIMMPEENENDSVVLLINPEFENLIFHNMDSSFTSKVVAKRFVVMRVKNDFINFVVNNLSEKSVFSSSFVNLLFTNNSESEFITHFLESNSLKNSSAELYTLPVSFKAFFNNSICSGLGGSSSTGCQSIFSQNSQSSSVTSLVFMNLSNMSFFINLITALANNSESSFMELSDLSIISAIKMLNKSDYKRLSVNEGNIISYIQDREKRASSSVREDNIRDLSNFSLQKISGIYSKTRKNRGKTSENGGKKK